MSIRSKEGPETSYPSSPMNWRIHKISLPASTAAMCSASVVDKATRDWSLELQETGPNSNSEGTHDISSESQRRDHSQEATDLQDHGNIECDEPGDLGNRKRQLNQVVNEYLRSSKKFKSDLPYVFISFFFTSILMLSFIVKPWLSINFITGPVASFDTLAHLYTCSQPLLRDLDWPLQRGLPPRPPLGE